VNLPTTISTQQTLNRNTTYLLTANTTVTIDVPFTAAPSSDGLGVVIDGQGYRLTIASVPNYTGSMDTTLSGAVVKNMTIASTGTTTIGGAGSYMFKLNIQNAQVINCLNIAPVAGSPDTAVFFGAFPSNCVASNCGNTGALNNVASSGVFGYGATRCLAVNCYNTAPLTSYSSGMYGSSASGSIASNCYNSGSATGDAFGAIFNRGYPGGVIGLNYISNCYSANTDFFAITNYTVLVNSGYNTTWTDLNAVLFLTGAPIPRSDLPGCSVGSVWYSSAENTPYTLYSRIPVSPIAGGTLTSPTQCNLEANTVYRLQGPLTVTGYNANPSSAPFNVLGGNVIFDGSGQTITVLNTADARGIFNASLAVLNLSVDQINSSLFILATSPPGWVFVNRVDGGFASNCTITSNAVTPYTAGGIFGGFSSNCSTLNCTNYGAINPAGGGMIGASSRNCVTSNCVSASGGSSAMVGEGSAYCTARNCVSTGPNVIPGYHGGLFGGGCAYCTAINCINTCSIIIPVNNLSSGGIFGYGPFGCTASNCYNTGTVGSVEARAIAPWSGGSTTITNCYTTNGLIGGETGATITKCSSNTDGIWRDATASSVLNNGNGLTGVPSSSAYLAAGAVWYSPYKNAPYLLVSLNNNLPCFIAGTRILTPTGYQCVETLDNGDKVTTSDGRVVSVKIFKTNIDKTNEDTAPFVVTKGAISNNVPDEDLHVSGMHVIQDAHGVWQIPAGLAMHPNSRVFQHLPGRSVSYYHIECPNYFTDNLVANNCIVESFRNKQGTTENSYEYDTNLGGFVRIMDMQLETGFPDKHVLDSAACR